MVIDSDGYKINVRITGEGEKTAVILDGWGTSLETYNFIADCINDKMRVIQFDLPGFGQTEEPKKSLCVDEYADIVCGILEKLEVKEATLIGHSFGGRLIIKLASRESIPFKITDIVLIDAAGIKYKSFAKFFKVMSYKIKKTIFLSKPFYSLFKSKVDEWKKSQGSADYREASDVMKGCLVKAVNEDLTKYLSHIECDALLIWGDKDTATPLKFGKIMEKKIKNAGLCVIKGGGHFSFADNPELFRRIIRCYFKVDR